MADLPRRRAGVSRLKVRPPASARTVFLLWLPAALVAGAILLPVFYLVLRAAGGERGLGALLFQAGNLQILWNSVALAAGVAVASALIAVPIAWFTVRTDLPFKRLWSVLTALPLVIPSYIGAYLMVSTFGPRGLLQGWLEPLGIERLPSIYGYPGALIILTLLTYPYTLLSVRAALKGMDPALEEAARVLGQTPWETFRRVILPQIRPAVVSGSLLVVLYTMRDFGAVAIMRYNTFTRAIYVQYQSLIDRSGAAALALVLIAVSVLVLILDGRFSPKRQIYSSTMPPRPPETVPLGRWKWPALLFCGGVVLISLGLPAANLVYWLARGLEAGEQLGSLWGETWNSMWISAVAALLIMMAALPMAILSIRRSGRLTMVLERLTYLGFALPGVVVALALVFFGSNVATFIYQQAPLLIFAYLVLFLPQALGAVQTSLMQVHPNLEEAGRSLGVAPLQVFARVTLPLLRPGLAAGLALVFLTAMKELPATLILSPFGFKTLATSVWGAVSEAFFARAALPALLLIIVSSVPMGFLILRRDL